MKNKFTAAPWKVSNETTPGEFVTTTHIRTKDNSHLAVVGPVNVAANANLMAAAPELLGALENLLQFEQRIASCDQDGGKMFLQIARAAIAKAKGEA